MMFGKLQADCRGNGVRINCETHGQQQCILPVRRKDNLFKTLKLLVPVPRKRDACLQLYFKIIYYFL